MYLAVLAAAVALSAALPSSALGGPPRVADLPSIQGPITGPGPMFSFLPVPSGTDLPDFGYVTEEYFVSGTAAGRRYKTRVVVRRPPRARKFSGIVIAEPMHFTGRVPICQFARLGIAQRGHACVEIDARPINLDDILKPFNAERYGGLEVGADQTNEVLAQVGRLIGAKTARHPLALFDVRTVVLAGRSDTSNVVRAYREAYAEGTQADRRPDGTPVYQGFFLGATLGPAPLVIADLPTIQMPTQTEVHATNSFRRPDSDDPANPFRIYEVAGSEHTPIREELEDNPTFDLSQCAHQTVREFPGGAMNFMSLQHLLDWVADGKVPPRAARIAVDDDLSDGTRVALDRYGNALGGIRTTYLDVPVLRYSVPNSGAFPCTALGYQTPLDPAVLRVLYRNRGQYVSRVRTRLAQLTREGWWPREYTRVYLEPDTKRYAAMLP